MTKAYTGGCQCGKVRYEAQADIGEVITCNCSRCRKVGSSFLDIASAKATTLRQREQLQVMTSPISACASYGLSRTDSRRCKLSSSLPPFVDRAQSRGICHCETPP